MNISDFVSQMGPNGMARTNRYSVLLDAPSVTGELSRNMRKILLFCDSINLPGLNINTTPIRTFGEVREIPYEFNYDPISLTFYVDGELKVKAFFDAWIKSIQQGNRRTFNYYDEYVCQQMHINVEDVRNKVPYSITLYEVYPKTITPIQMGYEQKDIMKIQVTFMYKYWSSHIREIEYTDKTPGQTRSPAGEMEATRYGPTGWQLADRGVFGTDFNPNKMGFDNIQKKFNDIFAEIGGGTADTGIVDTPKVFDRSSDYI